MLCGGFQILITYILYKIVLSICICKYLPQSNTCSTLLHPWIEWRESESVSAEEHSPRLICLAVFLTITEATR